MAGGRARLLLFVAGLGGLLYGIDVGIIAGALPYLESTASTAWGLGAQQLSYIVAAVLLGSVLSSLFAGMLSDLLGRRPVMVLSGLLFSLSIPVIALAEGYAPLLLGRLLQGVSAGLIGVAVPLYLAECLGPAQRGRGTGIFQLLLTLGLVLAALIGLHYARTVEGAAASAALLPDPEARRALLFAARDHAWRWIFWMSLTPGLVFTAGALLLAESPRWLFRRGRVGAARAALLQTRSPEEAERELGEMGAGAAATEGAPVAKESLLSRRYVVPFLLACVILACNQTTGINSILAYIVNILNRAGLPGSIANWGDLAVKLLNALMTVVAVVLVDRKGRKFLLMVGSGGIVLSLALAGLLFLGAERGGRDVAGQFQGAVRGDALLVPGEALFPDHAPSQLTLVYSYGPFTQVLTRRSDEPAPAPLAITRAGAVEADSVIGSSFRRVHLNPFPDPAIGMRAPLRIEQARLSPVPGLARGWLVAACILAFIASFAVGPGVCVWLALSELMPTRIRSNGMSIALLINQFVSTSIAAVFLPTVGRHGYAAMFFFWAACTVVYFLTAAFLLPETKGRSLEEIEAHFAGTAAR